MFTTSIIWKSRRHANTEHKSKPYFTGLRSDQLLISGRPRGDKRTVARGVWRCGARLVSQHHVHLSSVFLLNPHRPKAKRQTRLTQYTGGGLWCGSARLRPLRVSLLRSVSVPGALGAVAGRGRTTGGRRGCGACRCRPRVGHALYQRGATEDEGILREIVQRYRISGGGQSMGVVRGSEWRVKWVWKWSEGCRWRCSGGSSCRYSGVGCAARWRALLRRL